MVRLLCMAGLSLACACARADVTLDELRFVDLPGDFRVWTHTITAISGAKVRIESREVFGAPLRPMAEDLAVPSVRIVRGDRGKEYRYVIGGPRYSERDLQVHPHGELPGEVAKNPANCGKPKVTTSSNPGATIAGLETNETVVRVSHECKDPSSARVCTAIVTSHRWVAATAPFAAQIVIRSRFSEPELDRARLGVETLFGALLSSEIWSALESKMKDPTGVVVKSTFEFATLPCYQRFGVPPRTDSRDPSVFVGVSLRMLSGGMMMVWAQRNAGAKEPVTLFSQTSELMAARSEAIDQSRFELPPGLPPHLIRRTLLPE